MENVPPYHNMNCSPSFSDQMSHNPEIDSYSSMIGYYSKAQPRSKATFSTTFNHFIFNRISSHFHSRTESSDEPWKITGKNIRPTHVQHHAIQHTVKSPMNLLESTAIQKIRGFSMVWI
ncbi:hypothetical protein ACOME3_006344 [Neoechinorhynchus agilis]